MKNIAQYPFLRYLLCFIIGILIQNYFGPNSSFSYFWVLIPIAFFFFLHFSPYFAKKEIIQGFLGLFTIGFVGFLHVWNSNVLHDSNHFTKIEDGKYLKLRLNGRLEEKPKTYKVTAQIISVIDSNRAEHFAKGKILVYFKKEKLKPSLGYGSEILINNQSNIIESPKNPYEFDFKLYNFRQGIGHQIFLSKSDYVHLGTGYKNWLVKTAFEINHWADSVLKQHLGKTQEYAVATAMILGVRDEVDNDLMKAYSAAGAIHVLSVSGLHVGVIYGLLAWFLGFLLRKGNTGKTIYCIIILGILWFYALVTGLSAPVLRSTIMFSMFLMADILERDQRPINTLAFSAFLLLLFDPFFIWNIGFLLSYLAIVGMIIIQPILNPLIVIDKSKSWLHWLGDRLWKVTTVAVAAQIATFPLTVYYFHQFPIYFLLVNPVVILLSTVVLVFGLVYILFISFLPKSIALILDNLYFESVSWLNKTVIFTEQLPFSVAKYLFLNETQVVIMYLFFGFIVSIYFTKKYRNVQVAIALGLVLLVFSFVHFWKNKNQDLVYLAAVPKMNALVTIKSGKAKVFGNEAFINDLNMISFKLDGLFASKNVNHIEKIPQNNNNEVVEIKGLKFLLVKDGRQIFKNCPPVDVLILQHKYIDIENQILPHYRFKYVVIDGSVTGYYANKMKVILSQNGYYAHYVLEDGGLML